MENNKEFLKKILEFGIYQLDNNLCTPDTISSATKAAASTLIMDASIKELSDFFGVSEQSVKATINRKLIAKPKRKVVYPFMAFLKVVPDKWRNSNAGKDIHET